MTEHQATPKRRIGYQNGAGEWLVGVVAAGAAKQRLNALTALDRYFSITESLHGNGCEHGFKPAKACPNQECDARVAHEAWEALTK